MQNFRKFFPGLFCVLFFSCAPKEISYNYPDNPDYARKSRAGLAFSKQDLTIFGPKKSAKKSENTLANSPLWQAAVEVVGALFPIATLDSDSGIITSEWYQDAPNAAERVKITVAVKDSAIKKENLHVMISRQKNSAKKNSAAIWQASNPEDSNSHGPSANLILEKILEAAREK